MLFQATKPRTRGGMIGGMPSTQPVGPDMTAGGAPRFNERTGVANPPMASTQPVSGPTSPPMASTNPVGGMIGGGSMIPPAPPPARRLGGASTPAMPPMAQTNLVADFDPAAPIQALPPVQAPAPRSPQGGATTSWESGVMKNPSQALLDHYGIKGPNPHDPEVFAADLARRQAATSPLVPQEAAPPSAGGGASFGGMVTGGMPPAPGPGGKPGATTPAPPVAMTNASGGAPAAPGQPATTTATGNWQQELQGINWAPGEGTRGTAEVWNIKQKYGLTDEQLAESIKGADGKPLWTASQIAGHFQRFGYGAGPAPGVTGEKGEKGQITDSPMDYKNETIEGRIEGLLAVDENGNYTHPLIRQAADRQAQAFNSRGLRNSNMALQAAQEAAFAKAIEIAGPDARAYFENRRSNVDAGNRFAEGELGHERQMERDEQQNKFAKERDATDDAEQQRRDEEQRDFTMRQDYQRAVQNVGTNYQRQIDTINASQMTPADKSVAIAQATQMRDGELAYINNVYSRMPRWKNEWLSTAVPTEGMDIGKVGNIDMLGNIANDPAQPIATRDAARARMGDLQASQGNPGAVQEQANAGSYEQYRAAGGTMTYEQWAVGRQQGWLGGDNGGDGGDGGAGAAGGDAGSGGGGGAGSV